MPYLIDGHNLVPRVRGLNLKMLDDEHALIELLQEFCRRTRKQIEVYFDKAPAGMARSQKFGAVKAVFVRSGGTADQAIQRRLGQLGKAARNWTVVSSDRWVQAQARGAGAKVISSQDFARQVTQSETADPDSAETSLSQDELAEWLDLFGGEEQ